MCQQATGATASGLGDLGHPKNSYCQTHLSQEGTPWNALQIPLCLQSGGGGVDSRRKLRDTEALMQGCCQAKVNLSLAW